MGVVVELVSGYCNSRCVWCFTQYKCLDRMKKGMMSLENLKSFIDLNRNRGLELVPFSHGEALLNPDFVECCRYAISRGFTLLSLHTNLAMPLMDDNLDILANFSMVTVNVGGGKEITHYRNMGTSLDAVMSNLRRMNARKQNVQVKMVVNRRNIGEVSLLKERIEAINPRIPLWTMPLYFGPADSDDEDKQRFYRENLWGDSRVECRDKVEAKDGRIEVKPKTDKCYGLITTIRWDGSVEICCRGRYGERSLGNAFETPLRIIIGSQEYRRATEEGLRREYIGYCKFCS